MTKLRTLYERDFFAWSKEQAEALRAAGRLRTNEPVDWENVAEEIETLGRSERRELGSRIRQIIEHLVKLQLSPAAEPRAGWRASIREQRTEIADLLQDSPSLRAQLDEIVREQSRRGVDNAVAELQGRGELGRTPRRGATPGGELAYSAEQVLGDWYPPEPKAVRE